MTRSIKALIFLSVLALISLILSGAAALFDLATRRSIEYNYFSDAFDLTVEDSSFVNWLPAAGPLDRPLSEWEEDKVGLALSEAWRGFGAASATGITTYLPDSFSGIALERARKAVEQAQVERTRMVVVEMTARPIFYHADGSLLQLELILKTARFAFGPDGEPLIYGLRNDTTLTTMLNEADGWRVYSHELRQSEEILPPHPIVRPFRGRGLNYYPSETPWTAFWPNFDPDIFDKDVARMVSLKADSVRIFLPEADFCKETGAENLAKLDLLLEAADGAGLTVVPTLFDLKSGYDAPNWMADAVCLELIFGHLAGHSNIAFVDLKNEPDLDFDHYGRANVLAWLRTMAAIAKQSAPEIALSVGWSTPSVAANLAEVVDVISYHDYKDIGGIGARLGAVKATTGGRPVVVTEIGASSWGVALGFPGSPEKQAELLGQRLKGLADADGLYVWTLHDFSNVDPAAVGRRPWIVAKQAAFGLYDVNGDEKPAAGVFREAAAE